MYYTGHKHLRCQGYISPEYSWNIAAWVLLNPNNQSIKDISSPPMSNKFMKTNINSFMRYLWIAWANKLDMGVNVTMS